MMVYNDLFKRVRGFALLLVLTLFLSGIVVGDWDTPSLSISELNGYYCQVGGNCSFNILNVTVTNVDVTNTSSLQVDSFSDQSILFVNNSFVVGEDNFKWNYISQLLNITGGICIFGDCITSWEETKWNLTGSKYMINDSGVLDVNETVLNETIKSNLNNFVNVYGASLDGNDGDYNRTLTSVEPFRIVVDGWELQPGFDYEWVGGDIKFFNRIWDEHRISIYR